ncbi:pyridoxal phosphate-dependent decarboxylase family protein [Pararhodobacter zhoushanensis]|uniref:pyridoxal phosphate-dependent decarboxylase family protein n=1 Tax=Pararhodobacter zhoushanensis TaxID=2479545 RepID=UPI000F8EF3A7|nr:pyridoxal-dependent decarboxylase [Pararhodobacter zhoushanensis]
MSNLDPENWDEYRQQAHALLDACIDRLASAREHPWQPLPEAVRASYALDGVARGEGALAQELAESVLPHGTGNTHPRFWGWVHGTGLASGVMAEMVAATMNANLGGRAHGAVEIERAVIDWTRQVMGFPEGSSGVFVTGTSQATVIALASARVAVMPEVRARGQGAVPLTAYAGAGAHNAARKAMELLGMGHDALRLIPEGPQGMDLHALAERIEADRDAGRQPFAVVGTAGSVDLGRFDDLNALADLAQAQGLWLHIDGAFGAWTRLAGAPWRALSDGIGRADSLACDFHKWMFVPYDCGLVLIRDEATHRAAFAARPAYLAAQSAGLGGGEPWFCDYGVDLSRGNRALKAWSAIRAHGADGLGAAITRCCMLAKAMGDGVSARAPMALMAPVVSNLCVFTADAGLSEAEQSALNTRIAQALQLAGVAVFSTTSVNGVTCLRAAITNHRTTAADIEAALQAVADER